MRTHLHVHGTARSGHHAVIYWLVGCMTGHRRIHYANQVKPGRSPLEPANVNNDDFPAGLPVSPVFAGMQATDTDVLISSTEDVPVSAWDNTCTFPAVASYQALVVRDPFNQLASRLRLFETFGGQWHMERDAFIGGFPVLWLGHARRAACDTSLLVIDYGTWFDAESYRKGVCDEWSSRLGLTFDDRYLNFVSGHGRGSSFDGRDVARGGQRMSVHSRWEQYRNRPDFWQSLASSGPELLDAVEKRYGNRALLAEPIAMLRAYIGQR